MFRRMIKQAVFGAVGTWAWRRGRQWWDEREGAGGTTSGRRPAAQRRRTNTSRR